MITRINLTEPDSKLWFKHCTDIMHIVHLCRRVKRASYYTPEEVMYLTGFNYEDMFSFLARSNTIHAFMHKDILYIHPTGFEKYFMTRMKNHAIEAVTSSKNYRKDKQYIH